MILGLCGPKHSGKTELAKLLNARHGYWRCPFADAIKQMEMALLRLQGVSAEEAYRLTYIDKEEETEYLSGHSSRYFQKTIGTEWGRDLMDMDFWLGIWERRLNHMRRTGYLFEATSYFAENVVVEDVRFPNECDLIHHYGGKIIQIRRPGYPYDNTHLSETPLDINYQDFVILNDSTPEHMLQQVISLCLPYLDS